MDEATRAALQGLDAEDYRARTMALYTLGRLGDRATAPRIAALLGDGDYRVRTAALEALAALHDDAALPAVTALLHDREVPVRAAAAAALGTSGDASVLDPLIDRLLAGENEHVHLAAARALDALGCPKALSALVAAVRAVRDALLREELIRMVAGRCEPGDPTVVAALLEALDDADADVRAMVAYALGTVGDASALPALEYAAANDEGEHTLIEEGGLYTSNRITAEGAIAALLARQAGATTAEAVESARRQAPWRHRMPDYAGCRKAFVWERREDGNGPEQEADDGGATAKNGEAHGVVDHIRLEFFAPRQSHRGHLGTITVTWRTGWWTACGLGEDAVPELHIPWEAWGALAHCGDLLAHLGRAVGPAMQPAELVKALRECGFEDWSA